MRKTFKSLAKKAKQDFRTPNASRRPKKWFKDMRKTFKSLHKKRNRTFALQTLREDPYTFRKAFGVRKSCFAFSE